MKKQTISEVTPLSSRISTAQSYLRVAHADSADETSAFSTQFKAALLGYSFSKITLSPTGFPFLNCDKGTLYAWLTQGQAEVCLRNKNTVDSKSMEWLRIGAGDVLIINSATVVESREAATFWTIRVPNHTPTVTAGARRLADLSDTSGGCNIGKNAFRRLQITWQETQAQDVQPDGNNRLGCHVVWIAEETSRTHFHPVRPAQFGLNQQELYLVLDPVAFGLKPSGTPAGVWTFPKPGQWETYHFTELKPGDVCWIPAGVAHRAIDLLACVIAIPGFKPNNDVYVDPLISSTPNAPHNPHFSQSPSGQQ
jgi:hypothetical protein